MATILSVCTGNICRSPASALLLQGYLGDLLTATSAGTHALVGVGVPPQMLTHLDADAVVLASRDHAARQLNSELIDDADIIIAMAAEHRAHIVQQSPTAVHRTFLLDELAHAARAGARLDGASPRERLAHIPAAIGRYRPELATMRVADVPDPYRGSQVQYDETYRIIKDAIASLDGWVRAER
ncbi:low molecular weight phosphatase family protein [Demequina aurantiaca]|uniref:arsenate reductase/protein-tyrosine-phosphatase family protein n=1 Tax=Demequina aurantiaca TaxID=676200 RepID=UPI003D33CE14